MVTHFQNSFRFKAFLFSLGLCLSTTSAAIAANISISGATQVCPGQDYTYTASASNAFGSLRGSFEWTFWRNNQMIESINFPIIDCPGGLGTSTSTVTFNWGTVLGPVRFGYGLRV